MPRPIDVGVGLRPAPGIATAASEALLERGFLVAAIRPPTVPAGSSRLRVTLSAAHEEEDVERLVEALADVLQRCQAPFRGGDSPHAGTVPVETVPGTPDIP